jgi:hypothetical protein
MEEQQQIPERVTITDGEGKKKFGRTPIPIDWNKVDMMLIKGCGVMLIAHRLGVDDETLRRRGVKEKRWGAGTPYETFEAYKQAKRAIGDDSILERQYDMAMGIFDPDTKSWISPPDKTMLIWLGKQRCDQSDRMDTTTRGKEMPAPITHVVQIIEKPEE